jgi:hypothetical protein
MGDWSIFVDIGNEYSVPIYSKTQIHSKNNSNDLKLL